MPPGLRLSCPYAKFYPATVIMVRNFGHSEEDAVRGKSIGNSGVDIGKRANFKRARRSQSSEEPSVLVSAEDGDSTVLQARAYQREMLEQSLERNIIVAVQPPSRSRGFSDIPRWILAAVKRKSLYFELLES